MTGRMLTIVGAAALLLAACSTAPMNEPLKQSALNDGPGGITVGGYRPTALPHAESSDQLLVLLASSGGGKRSAAFSYGVLRGLRDFEIQVNGSERRLLDELDTYAAVSGGSFPAAYYGLYRERTFETFERDFLKADIDDYIWGIYLFPWKWEWMVNPALRHQRRDGDDLRQADVSRCDLCRPHQQRQTLHLHQRHRHQLRQRLRLQPGPVRSHLLRSLDLSHRQRRRRLERLSRPVLADHADELLRRSAPAASPAGSRPPMSGSRCRASTTWRRWRASTWTRRRPATSTSWTAASPTTWRCAS